MKVSLLASTTLNVGFWNETEGTDLGKRALRDAYAGLDIDSSGITVEPSDLLAEFAGRSCYQSFNLPNPATAENKDYMSNIISQGHFSVFEHASATFYISGVSRALTHELIRHRHLSYSELSQRFVNVEDADMITPPALNYTDDGSLTPFEELDVFDSVRTAYAGLVEELTAKGYTRKQAREAARAVMPNATETRIVVTGNMRAWRDFLHKRYSVHADAEIQALATEILKQLRTVSPAAFQDFPEVPFA